MQNATIDDFVKNHAVFAQERIKLILVELVDHIELEGRTIQQATAAVLSVLTASAAQVGSAYYDHDTFIDTMSFAYTRAKELRK